MTLIALETTSSGFALESSTISSTIVSEVLTEGDTSTTDAASESTSTIEATTIVVSASTEATSTAESIIATQTTISTETGVTDTTTAPTSIETTATTEATTAEHPVITDFRLKGSRGSVEGAFIYSDHVKGNNLVFSGNNPAYSPAIFSIEALTGRLLIDNSLYVCALFRPGQDIASLGTCNEIPESSEVDVICTPPAKNGDTLSCSVPGLSCASSSMCTSTGEILTDTSTDFNYNVNENIAVIGQIANGVSFVVHAL
ncbi:hypothetical protein EDB82DRAFT_560804 [Fusarium venenatum]|uniref:uncharacterized protein n=1 Tax=Fusarium venenatum TaxID=56646 RepID=UPI001D21DE3C|nr:hypothetical protein EDB82DRAFT_560804 [Fusarium venenatum]